MARPSLHANFSDEVLDGGGRSFSRGSSGDDPLGRQRSVTRGGREIWASRRSFLLAAMGAAIGTGNVWRFPYLCFKYGGGSFLVPYFLAMGVLGIPIMVLELSLGQHRQKAFVYTLHEIHPALAGLGWATVLNTFLSAVFYCVVMAWSALYLVRSFSQPWANGAAAAAHSATPPGLWWLAPPADAPPGSPPTLYADPCELPALDPAMSQSVVTFFCGLEHQWLGCTPPELQYAIGTPNSTAHSDAMVRRNDISVTAEPRPDSASRSAAEVYFTNEVLRKSGSMSEMGSVQVDVLFALLLVWVAIYFCISKGVKSTGRVVWVTVPLPCLLLFVLMIRGMTLEGAGAGLMLFITPDLSLLWSIEIWQQAATQIMFSTSISLGVLPTYASFNPRRQDVVRDSVIIVLANSFFSVISAVTVFSVLGFMAAQTRQCVADVTDGGPALAFIAFPKALSMMPASSFFSFLFFLMMLFLGIDSAFSLAEALSSALIESLPYADHPGAKYVPVGVCAAGVILGIPFTMEGGYYWFEWANHYIIFPLTLVACAECIGATWVRDATLGPSLKDDIENEDMLGREIWGGFRLLWYIVCPLICGVLFLSGMVSEIFGLGDDMERMADNPAWTNVLGWWIGLGPMAFMITYFKWGPGSSIPKERCGALFPPSANQAMTRELTRGTTLPSGSSGGPRP